MAGTSGLCSDTNGVAQLAIAALNGGTALAITTPLKIAALSVVRTANNGSDTEWATAAGYTAAPAPGTGGAGTTGWAFPAMNEHHRRSADELRGCDVDECSGRHVGGKPHSGFVCHEQQEHLVRHHRYLQDHRPG
jgi:hypothetical protein